MNEKDKTKLDIRFGKDGIERLERMARSDKTSPSTIARQAVIAYELSRANFRDTVSGAVLDLFRALNPDELYDSADDPRTIEAVDHLGELLASSPAAEGIAQAFTLLIAQNPHLLPDLKIPAFPPEMEDQ